ncbi:MAG: 50S ribosomal protein L10 [Actinomycetaceae bacterium]|nr:50S ribosomal protein L10 [Actinomycetaceae bacterium]MDY6082819.1 50S ribosomal protein L10 [Actinomycetaceae bacterium]
MAKADKSAEIAELTSKFEASSGVLLTEYRGLTVAQLQQLRRALRPTAEYKVAKNTLALIGAKKAGFEDPDMDNLFAGPSGFVFVSGEVPGAAKVLRDFAKDNPALIVKGGIFEGKVLFADDVKALADLESRDVLLAKTAGVLKASLYKAASLFQAPVSKAVRTIDALRAKEEAAA